MSEADTEKFDDELLSAYLDDELAPEARARVEKRLQTDPHARQLLEELRGVSQAMRDLPSATVGDDLRESVLRRAERAMLVDAGASARGLNEVARKLPFGRSKRAWAWAGAAIAAALLLMVIEREPGTDNEPKTVAKLDQLPPLEVRAIEAPEEKSGAAAVAVDMADRVDTTGTVDTAAGEELVVVYVNVKPEALRSKAIDGVLARNQIEVEQTMAAEPSNAATEEVDLVLVEAAPAQIMSSLAEINADSTNFLSIDVGDERAERGRAATDKQVVEFQQYSRGMVPAKQKLQVAPNNNFYVQTRQGPVEFDSRFARSDTAVGSELLAKSEVPPTVDKAPVRRAAEPLAAAGATRELAYDSYGASSAATAPESPAAPAAEPSGELQFGAPRQAMQKLSAKADMLQVLFVLTAQDEAASSPAAANSSE